MHLTLIEDLSLPDSEVLGLYIHSILAFDPLTQAKMTTTRGHQKSGRPTRYFVSAPTGERYSDGQPIFELVLRVTAWSEGEAVAKANQRLARLGPNVRWVRGKGWITHDDQTMGTSGPEETCAKGDTI